MILEPLFLRRGMKKKIGVRESQGWYIYHPLNRFGGGILRKGWYKVRGGIYTTPNLVGVVYVPPYTTPETASVLLIS